jgi:eukaryotic-like serine/threonine-protein kinase
VLELVAGPTLADRIAQGSIRLDEALSIAKQITAALEAARDQGIIHRDLKPANIKLRSDGAVKVLDFGLAKIGAGQIAGEAFSHLPTETIGGTRIGAILGTAAYMSPEQARGLPMDQRTDVWAFGCVLYEMLSGRSAFGGGTFSDTIARILEREPDWQALPSSTPRPIRELLRRCLRKDLQSRLRDIVGARLEIDEAIGRLAGPRRKVIGVLTVAAGLTLALTLLTAMWWLAWNTTPLVQREIASTQQYQPASTLHEPVAIVIADFQNNTDDPIFNRVLELTLRRALEESGFVNAYDRSRMRTIAGVQPPDKLDEEAARAIAVKQGFGVVVSGSIDRRGNGFELSVRAVQPVTGEVISSVRRRASNKEQVLEVVARLVSDIRTALGDETSESHQLFAMRSVSTASLDVLGHYAAAMESQSRGRFEEARQSLVKATELDPKFGLGYQGLVVLSRNLGNLEDADKYTKQALAYLEGMTDRERYTTRAFFYVRTDDYHQCAKEYGEMIARYAADVVAHNNRALCLSKLRNMREAVNEMRQALKLMPKHRVLQANLAIYAAYAGDFQTAGQEARAIPEPYDLGTLALAFAQLGQGLAREAADTYQKLGTISSRGASWARSGLGDLALYEGRFSDAARLFEQGAAADLASENPNRAARKFAALAYAQLWRGRKDLAIAAAEKALVNSRTGAIRFLFARVFVQAGAIAKARTEAARISLGTFVDAGPSGAAGGPAAEPEAYAKIVEAEIALANDDPRQAIKLLTEANALANTWMGHFDLGLAYLKVPAFALADSEFDLCLKRRGEATSLFFDEEPTHGFFPAVFYYQGMAREGLNRADFKDSFRAYMNLRGKSTEDPLLLEVRQRISP